MDHILLKNILPVQNHYSSVHVDVQRVLDQLKSRATLFESLLFARLCNFHVRLRLLFPLVNGRAWTLERLSDGLHEVFLVFFISSGPKEPSGRTTISLRASCLVLKLVVLRCLPMSLFSMDYGLLSGH